MSAKKIRKIGDPVLREKSRKVEKIDKNLLELVNDMIDTLNKEGGVGLAAPQIGVTRRVIIINFNDKIQAFINPEIEVLDDEKVESEEGCLSIYSIQGYSVKRFSKIKVRAKDLKGNAIKFVAEDLLSRIFQHEVDHLNGILFIGHLDAESRRELLSKVSEISQG